MSLFNSVNEEEAEQEMMEQQLQKSMSELIANRNSAMQKYSQETVASISDEEPEAMAEPAVYTKEEIFPDVARYFGALHARS